MSNFVPGVGPLDARILAVGEAPGQREDELKQPFVGPAGELLDSFLRGAGLNRPQIRIDNLRPYRPPDNNLKRVPKDEMAQWTENLHDRIANLKGLYVIVPQGNWALQALLGLDRITKRRGSIYQYIDRRNRPIKVIPTIHPASVFRQPSVERRIRIDWQRIAGDSLFRELNIPQRNYIIHPSKAVIKDWVRECLAHCHEEDFTLVCDIETPKDKMVCVGFSWREDEAISIPVDDKEYWPNSNDRKWALGIVKYLLEELPGSKGFQNGLFDCLPGDAEVLTPDGWVRFNRLAERQRELTVAQWEQGTGTISWVKPDVVIEKDYDDDMICFTTRSITSSMTRTHRLPTTHGTKLAEDAFQHRIDIITSGKLSGGQPFPFIELLVAIQADAHLSPTRADFNFKKPRKIERILEIAKRCGCTVRDRQRPEDESGFSLTGFAVRVCYGLLGAEKEFGPWLLEFDQETRERFIEELSFWDGHQPEEGTTRYSTGSATNAQWVATVCHVSGYAATVRQSGCWVVNIRQRDTHAVSPENWHKYHKKGKVYCLSVPSSYFLVRYKGTIHVTGNCFWLRMYGISPKRWFWDSLTLHHCLDSTDEHSLGYMASIDLRHQYHKDDVHAELKGKGFIRNWDTFWTYNATDAAVTMDLIQLYRQRVRERGLEQFYFDHYVATSAPLLDMMLNGILMDDKRRRRKLADLMIHYLDIQEELQSMAGYPLHSKKTLSTAKIKKYLYETLGLPKMINRSTGEPTTKEVALRRLLIRLTNRIKQEQFQLRSDGLDRPRLRETTRKRIVEDISKGQQGVKALNLILDHRRTYQLSLFLPETRLDDDSKMRTQYGYSTETGRLTSSKSPMRLGGNNQNIDREVRNIFLPDPGYIFLEIDLSQVEWRIMTMFTHDEALMELGRSKPWEFDIHNYNGGIIFSVDEAKVSKSQRYLAKRSVHGCVDDQTDVLTPEGWLPIKLLTTGHKIAQWNPGNESISFAHPSKVYEYDFDGKLDLWEGRAISQALTEDHRTLYWTNQSYKWTTSSGLRELSAVRLPLAGKLEDAPNDLTDAEVQLAAAIQADGSYLNHHQVRFHLKKKRKIDRLECILNACSVQFKRSDYKDRTTSIWFEKPRATILDEDKTFGPQLLRLTQHQREVLLEEVLYWDGHLRYSRTGKGSYYSAVEKNIDWIQTIAHLSGREALKRDKPYYRAIKLQLNRRKHARRPEFRTIDYKGKVYCPTVPTSAFLIRRNGAISVTGNCSYGMTGNKLSELLLLDGIVRDPVECQAMLDTYIGRFPAIRVWQDRVAAKVRETRTLVNSWGRTINFKWDKLGDDLYRRAYAFGPQSENAGLLNQYGLIPAYHYIKRNHVDAHLNAQVHDSLLLSVRPDSYELCKFICQSLERTREYEGEPLSVPATPKLGISWAGDVEFKKFPSKSEYEEVAYGLHEKLYKEVS